MMNFHQQELERDRLGLVDKWAKLKTSGVALIVPKLSPLYDDDDENGGKMKGFYFPHQGTSFFSKWNEIGSFMVSINAMKKIPNDYIEEIKTHSNCGYSYSEILQCLFKPSDYWDGKRYGWEEINISLVNDIMAFSRKRTDSKFYPAYKVLAFINKWGPLWKCTNHDLCYLNKHMEGTSCGCIWKPFEPLQDYLDLSAFFVFFTRLIISLEAEDNFPDLMEQIPNIPSYNNLIAKILDFMNLSEQRKEKKIFALITLFNHIKAHNAFELTLSVERFGKDDSYIKPAWDMGLGVGRAAWFIFFRQLLEQGKIAICDRCFHPYMRGERRAKAGQKNYCDDCRPIKRGSS